MTEFAEEVRHYCRNPKCRMKLPSPVPNDREAFCTRGCYRGFYRKRCLICEASMERETERKLVCGKVKCSSALRAANNMGRYHPSSGAVSPFKNPIKPGTKSGAAPDRGIDWAIAVNSSRIRAPRRVLAVEVYPMTTLAERQ